MRLEELRVHDSEAHAALEKAEPETWCRAFFTKVGRYDDVCNNLSESFNNTIKEARELPLINMLETIRILAVKRISRIFKKASKCVMQFTTKVAKILEKNRDDSKKTTVIISSDNLYEVSLFGCSYEVSLRTRHCACQIWDLTGIPCSHTIRVINEIHHEPENYVDPYYKTSVWIDTYKENIKPVNGEIFWKKTGKEPIGVPGVRKMYGRPKKKRMKAAHESPSKPNRTTRDARTMTCSHCKKVGHNRSTCKNPAYLNEAPKRKRGRPPKLREDVETNPNRPLKRRITQSQSSHPTTSFTTQSQSSMGSHRMGVTFPSASSVPQTSTQLPSRGRPRGRPPGRGQAPIQRGASVPRGHGIFMCPNTNRVFEVWGNKSREIGGGRATSRGRGRGRGH